MMNFELFATLVDAATIEGVRFEVYESDFDFHLVADCKEWSRADVDICHGNLEKAWRYFDTFDVEEGCTPIERALDCIRIEEREAAYWNRGDELRDIMLDR